VRAEYVSVKALTGAGSDPFQVEGVFKLGPHRPHDRVVEGDQRFGDAAAAPVGAKRIDLASQQADVLQDGQRAGDVGGLAADLAGDPAPGVVAGGHSHEDGVVERCR
jgi:hypothetical protein